MEEITSYGIIVPAVVALVVAVITVIASRIIHTRGLNHDAKMRKCEREMSIRREVYLNAAEAIMRRQGILGRMSDLGVPEKDLTDELGKTAGIIAKVEVVGTDETVQAINKYGAEYDVLFLELLLKRFHLLNRKSEIEQIKEVSDRLLKEQGQSVKLMKQLRIENNKNQDAWSAVERVFEDEVRLRKENQVEWSKLSELQGEDILQLIKLCYEVVAKVAQCIPPVLFAIRKELELPIDEDLYVKSLNERLEGNKAVLCKFLDDVRSM